MPIRALIIAAAVVVLAAVVYTQIRPTQVDPAPLTTETAQEQPATPQGDGPILVIEVAGEANGTIEIELFDQTAPDHVTILVRKNSGSEPTLYGERSWEHREWPESRHPLPVCV